MSLSPCRRDKMMKAARAQVAQAQSSGIAPENSSLHLQLIALETDLKRLKSCDRISDRITMKRDELLPKYRPFIERYLAENEIYTNSLFAHVVVWLFDVGEFQQGIEWALLCIEQQQPTPDNMKRNWPHFVADSVLAWCEVQAENGQAVEPYCSQVFKHVREDWRLNEKLTAKWWKFVGLMLIRDEKGKPKPSAVFDIEQLEKARVIFQTANDFHTNVGVKTYIEKIDMRIRKLTGA